MISKTSGKKITWLNFLVPGCFGLLVIRALALPPVPYPPENPHSDAKAVLGKILFWDEQLSSDNTVSCGTCHIPSSGGADPRIGIHPGADGLIGTVDDVFGSLGIRRYNSNMDPIEVPHFGSAPQVTGRSAQPYFGGSLWAPDLFWDGRATSEFHDPVTDEIMIPSGGGLESQSVGPIVSSVEMAKEGRAWDEVTSKLEQVTPLLIATNIPQAMQDAIVTDPTYPDLFARAFGDPQITPTRIAFAIATYERTLVADQTPWDRFIAGDESALNGQEQVVWNLLRTPASLGGSACADCHRWDNDIVGGVVPFPTFPTDRVLDLSQDGIFTDNTFVNLGFAHADADVGREGVTGNADDRGAFKTPGLRNLGLRRTFFHNGRATSLEEVMFIYNQDIFLDIFDPDTLQISPARGPRPDGETLFAHFTEFQDIVPDRRGPNVRRYDTIIVSNAAQPLVAFFSNALVDPRVANEQPPYDRPTLWSEANASRWISVIEGIRHGDEASTTPGQFIVVQSAETDTDTVLNYSILGSATQGTDYSALSGTLTIPAGELFGSVFINVIDDPDVEVAETVVITIDEIVSGDSLLALHPVQISAQMVIEDNDGPVAGPMVYVTARYQGQEGQQGPVNGQFEFHLTSAQSQSTLVSYTIGGTATISSDYTGLTGTATIVAGETSFTVDVAVVDDALTEGSETVAITLDSILSGAPELSIEGDRSTSSLFIFDNESPARADALVPDYVQGFGLSGGDADLSADPDDDGRSNFEEWARGTDPSTADAELTEITLNSLDPGVVYEVRFRRLKSYVAAGLQYKIFYSGNLIDWALTMQTELSASDLPDIQGYEEVVVSIIPTVIPTDLRGFFRVKIEAAGP